MIHNVNLVGTSPVMHAGTNAPEQRPFAHVFPDRITCGEDEQSCCGSIFSKIGGAFSWVWESLKSFFQTLFFCCDYSKPVDGQMNLQELTKLRNQFKSLQTKFVTKRDTLDRPALITWWQKIFDSLSKQGQILIMKKEMEGPARHKLSIDNVANPTEDQIAHYVEALFKMDEKRASVRAFVRDLKIFEWEDGGKKRVDAVDVLPTYFKQIADQLDLQISKLEQESK